MTDPTTTATTELAIHVASQAGEMDKADITAEMVTAALIESRSWIAVAMQGTDPTPIAEFKAWAATVEEATKQKKLGRDIELDAAEMVRRAERGIGVAIRNGQKAGEIASRDSGDFGPKADYQRDGEMVHVDRDAPGTPISPKDFASKSELSSTHGGIYDMTDGVSDEQFEEAVVEAKAEGDLRRANVVRKVKGKASGMTRKQRADRVAELAESGHSSRQIAKKIGLGENAVSDIIRDFHIDVPANKTVANTRRPDTNRIAQETVNTLAGLAMGVELIDESELDPQEAPHWDASLTESIRVLTRFHRKVIRKAHQ